MVYQPAGSDYLPLLSITVFLACTWAATKISRTAGVSSVVPEIAVGILLGPSVWGHVAPAWSECLAIRHAQCKAPSDLLDRAISGQSLGRGLDAVAAGSYCERSEFEPWRSGAYIDATTVGGEPEKEDEEEEDGGNAADTTEDGDNAAEEPEDGDNAADEPEDGGNAAEETEEAAGVHRRVSAVLYESDEGDRGIGVKVVRYVTVNTYEQCLVRHCEEKVAHQCQLTPSFLTLVGQAGVMLMFFESGILFDFAKVRHVGPRAFAIACVGFILPMVAGMLLTIIFGKPLVPDGVYVGTALVPTSISFTLRLLSEAGVLQEEFSQHIVTAAYGSDLLSLVWFCVMFNWRTEFQFVSVIILPLVGIVLTVLAMVSAVHFWPTVIKAILARIPELPQQRVSPRDKALFVVMMIVALGYATVFHFLGIYLWGCFVAGISFAAVEGQYDLHSVWVRQTKRATSWMIRIFFAAAVGFSIPVSTFFTWEMFWKGTIMGVGPCILTKVCCAVFMGNAKFVIGWAMVGRAELAFFIAQMALSANMMDSESFSITIWALLYATVFAPLIFRKVLERYVREFCPDAVADAKEEQQESQMPKADILD